MSQMFFSGIRDNQSRGKVIDFLKNHIHEESNLSFVSAFFTIYAYDKLKTELESIGNIRFLFGEPRFLKSLDPEKTDKKSFNIEDNELSLANRLEQSKIAAYCQKWIENKVEIRSIKKPSFLHGKLYHIQHSNNMEHAILGSSNFTVNGYPHKVGQKTIPRFYGNNRS